MKRFSLISAIFMLTFSLSVTAPAYADPDIEVTPLYHDFGEVEVGTSSIATITIYNYNGHPLVITDIDMTAGSSADFFIVTDLQFPIVLDTDDLLHVDVVFSPSSEGPLAADMEIYSNDPDESLVVVALYGVGAGAVVTIEEILNFFDESVESGTLEGRGYRPGLKIIRVRAMRSMLVAASKFIEREKIAVTCRILKRAYKRCDGEPWPPDFIIGEARPQLADMILDLGESLGCK